MRMTLNTRGANEALQKYRCRWSEDLLVADVLTSSTAGLNLSHERTDRDPRAVDKMVLANRPVTIDSASLRVQQKAQGGLKVLKCAMKKKYKRKRTTCGLETPQSQGSFSRRAHFNSVRSVLIPP